MTTPARVLARANTDPWWDAKTPATQQGKKPRPTHWEHTTGLPLPGQAIRDAWKANA